MRVICPNCLSINNVPKKDSYLKANCGKCKESLLNNKPINLTNANFDESAKKYPLKAVFAKVNTEVEQDISGKYHIMSIPTLIVYKNA